MTAKDIHNQWIHGPQPDEPDREEQDDIELEEEAGRVKVVIAVLILSIIALSITLSGALKEIYLLNDALTMSMMRANQWEAEARRLGNE